MFDASSLKENGFEGFIPLRSLPDNCPDAPVGPGVYAVVAPAGSVPGLLEDSCGGHFKGKDPVVSLEKLEQKWVPDAEVLYLGKTDNLRRRLNEFAKFGRGHAIGHWGGRYIWQLAARDQVEVAWMSTPDPSETEAEMIDAFEARYGRLPFANLVRGRRGVKVS